MQSLILAAVFLITGFHTWLIALLADLIAVNRRLSEDVLMRVKRLESPESASVAPPRQPDSRSSRRDAEARRRVRRSSRRREPRREPRRRAAAAAKPDTQWVWLLDEDKLENRGAQTRGARDEARAARGRRGRGRRR